MNSDVDTLRRLDEALGEIDRQPPGVLDVTEVTTPWRYVIGIGVSFALSVALLSGALAYLAGAYAITHSGERIDSAVDDRNDRLAQQQRQIDEYRRQQCVITFNLPEPHSPEVIELRRLLRCSDFQPEPRPSR